MKAKLQGVHRCVYHDFETGETIECTFPPRKLTKRDRERDEIMTKERLVKVWGYDEKFNYKSIIETYNTYIKEGNVNDAHTLLKEHGGMIALIVKADFQNKTY